MTQVFIVLISSNKIYGFSSIVIIFFFKFINDKNKNNNIFYLPCEKQ
jgi:hypothetical protein